MMNQSGRGVETRDPEVCERSECALFTVSLKALQDKKRKKKLLFRAWCRQIVKLPEALLHGIILGLFWDFLRRNGNGKQWKHESNQTSCSVLYWTQSKCGFNQKLPVKEAVSIFFPHNWMKCPFAVYCIHSADCYLPSASYFYFWKFSALLVIVAPIFCRCPLTLLTPSSQSESSIHPDGIS